MERDYHAAVRLLIAALGIDPSSFERYVAWCLAEELVSDVADVVAADPAHRDRPLWQRQDGLRRFRDLLTAHTRRRWSAEDYERLFERVRMACERHDRRPVSSGDLLRLLWNVPHVCVRCGRRPPDVVLHIDHRFPVARGGSSAYENLQFLCAADNLRKSDTLEEEDLWLSSV